MIIKDHFLFLSSIYIYIYIISHLRLEPVADSCGVGIFWLHGGAVFHVTDQLGNKLTDESLLLYIQQVSLFLFLSLFCLSSSVIFWNLVIPFSLTESKLRLAKMFKLVLTHLLCLNSELIKNLSSLNSV